MILITVWILLTLNIIWPLILVPSNSRSNGKLPKPEGVNYLVVAPQGLSESASAWADYRQSTGYETQVILISPDRAKAEEIRALVQETFQASGQPYPGYVLLLGHAHPFSSYRDAYLPTTHFSVDPVLSSAYGAEPIPSDDALVGNFSYESSTTALPIFVGRIPVRTEEESFLLLERTQKYEKVPPRGEGRARIELITSNAGFGAQYDPLFEWALRALSQKSLPDEYRWHRLNGNPDSLYSYPIDSFPNEVAKRFDTEALAVVYIGHGQPELLGWARSPDGESRRIFGLEDVRLIQSANASIGIFTACSAGAYDLAGDNLSIVESIYLTPGGPVATYSSSAWINGALNGRLVIGIFAGLLVDRSSTLGEWVNRVEYEADATDSHLALISFVKAMLPRVSGIYENKLLLSRTDARQVLDIQNATYNLFGDPALRIAYPQPGIEIKPIWLWRPWKGKLEFSGKSKLPPGQQVWISLEALPGAVISQEALSSGTMDGYFQANDPIMRMTTTYTATGGDYSGRIIIPDNFPSGKYLLRAVSLFGQYTFVTAHPVYIGWTPIIEFLSSGLFWWSLSSGLFITKGVYHLFHKGNDI